LPWLLQAVCQNMVDASPGVSMPPLARGRFAPPARTGARQRAAGPGIRVADPGGL